MYSLIISIVIGLAVGTAASFWYLGFGIFIGLAVTLASFILFGRKFSGKLQAIFNRANVEIQKQNPERAMEILEEGYALNKWQFMVKSQIESQIGVILYTQKKFGEAYKHLINANPRIYVAYAMLIIGHVKNHKEKEAENGIYLLTKMNKKEAFVHSLSAYIYENELNDRKKALEALKKGLKFLPNNSNLHEHLNDLQNNKQFKMSRYGDVWYQMMLDKNVAAKLQQKYMKAQNRRVNIKKNMR